LGQDFRGAGIAPAPQDVQKWLDSPLLLPESAGPEEIFPHAERFQFSTKR
jgi:hypothetical protein